MAKEISILFLDDENSTLDILRNDFAQEPYGIATTNNPDQAMEILKKEKIKVVICDQVMPKMHGVQFLQNVKQYDPNIVRILLSAYSDHTIVEEAVNIGEVYRVIAKPWKRPDLISAVHRSIERYDLTMK